MGTKKYGPFQSSGKTKQKPPQIPIKIDGEERNLKIDHVALVKDVPEGGLGGPIVVMKSAKEVELEGKIRTLTAILKDADRYFEAMENEDCSSCACSRWAHEMGQRTTEALKDLEGE